MGLFVGYGRLGLLFVGYGWFVVCWVWVVSSCLLGMGGFGIYIKKCELFFWLRLLGMGDLGLTFQNNQSSIEMK